MVPELRATRGDDGAPPHPAARAVLRELRRIRARATEGEPMTHCKRAGKSHGAAFATERFRVQPMGWPMLQIMECHDCRRLFVAIEGRTVHEATTQQLWNQIAVLTVARTTPGDAPDVPPQGGCDEEEC